MPEEDFEELSNQIYSNKTGLDHLDKHVYPKMFGYKDDADYYKKVSVDNYIQGCKVPLFCLSANDDMACDPSVVPHDIIKGKGS